MQLIFTRDFGAKYVGVKYFSSKRCESSLIISCTYVSIIFILHSIISEENELHGPVPFSCMNHSSLSFLDLGELDFLEKKINFSVIVLHVFMMNFLCFYFMKGQNNLSSSIPSEIGLSKNITYLFLGKL